MSVAIPDFAGSELGSAISSLLGRRECGTTVIGIITGYFIDNNKDQANERIFLGNYTFVVKTQMSKLKISWTYILHPKSVLSITHSISLSTVWFSNTLICPCMMNLYILHWFSRRDFIAKFIHHTKL